MKKIIIILFIIALTLTGCKKNDFKLSSISDTYLSDNDIILSVVEGSLTNMGTTVFIMNNSDKVLGYTSSYQLEVKQAGIWRKTDIEILFNDLYEELEPNDYAEVDIIWGYDYGELIPGTYRIIKDVAFLNSNGEETQTFNIGSEFVIE